MGKEVTTEAFKVQYIEVHNIHLSNPDLGSKFDFSKGLPGYLPKF